MTKYNTNLKIMLCVNRFYPEIGGAETNLFLQAKYLAKHHDVTVYTPKRSDAKSSENLEKFKVKRLFDLFNLKRRFPNLKANTFCPSLFFHILFARNLDVILTFPSVNFNAMLALLAAKIKRVPIIMCSFDAFDYSEIIKSGHQEKIKSLSSQDLPGRERFVAKYFSKILVISDRERRLFSEIHHDVEYVPVPFNEEEFLPLAQKGSKDSEQPSGDSDIFTFLCLGRISEIKGQDLALEAFIEAEKKMPNARLVFVGRSDYASDYYDRLQTRIRDLSLEDKVSFTGAVPRNEVINWLAQSDISVFPVRFMNSGAVITESWAANTGVIQSDAVDPNLVEPEHNGLLFASENVAQLSEAMVYAYNNPKMTKNMGINGNKLAYEGYTYEKLIAQYERIIGEIRS